MSEQIQELIDKIKTEGVQAADQRAREIEEQAKKKANDIIEQAKKKARQMIVDADNEIKKTEGSTRKALQQASRDMLLSLKKEIQNTLRKIVSAKIKEGLTAEDISRIILEISRKAIEGKTTESGIELILNPEDLQKLKDGFLFELQRQLKLSVHLRPSEDIGRGFLISFDKGKSNFDFTEAGLAQYLSAYLNDEVSALLKEAAVS